MERFTPVAFDDVGSGSRVATSAVCRSQATSRFQFPFIGTIVRAEIWVTGPVVHDPVAEVAVILASQ